MIDWGRYAEDSIKLAATVGSIIFFLAKNRKKAKDEQDVRHAENQEKQATLGRKLDTLLNEQEFLPQHYHDEMKFGVADVPLTTTGVSRRPTNGQKSR